MVRETRESSESFEFEGPAQEGPNRGKRVFKPKREFSMPRIKLLQSRKFKLGLFIAALLVVCYGMFLSYVGPNHYGIRVNKLITPRGVQKEIYPPGLHLVIPKMQEMYTLPRDIQVLELTNSPDTAAHFSRIETPAAHIQTSDGFYVDVDVSVLYHIEDPYKTFTMIGPGTLFEENGIIPKTEPALKEALGELTTEEFYNSPLRVKKTQEALDRLNRELQPKGIKVDHILIRYFSYSPEIQKNIEEKKLKDQLVFKNQAEGRAAIEAAKFKKVSQEGEMQVQVTLAEGEAYVTKRKAEMDLYRRKVRAQADLLIKLAEAKKTELRNTALQGLGSDRMVGLNMAKALAGLEMVVLPSDGAAGVNPLDLRKLLELFEVRHNAAQGGSFTPQPADSATPGGVQ